MEAVISSGMTERRDGTIANIAILPAGNHNLERPILPCMKTARRATNWEENAYYDRSTD